jgi:hypothetical protein
VIDAHDVIVRLKRGLVETYDPTHWGRRTDYLCARSPRFDHGMFPFWLVSGVKYSTGYCAVLETIKRLAPDEIYLIGFDWLLHPDRDSGDWLAHSKWVEHELLKRLGVKELS